MLRWDLAQLLALSISCGGELRLALGQLGQAHLHGWRDRHVDRHRRRRSLLAAFATVTLIAKAVGFVNVDWHTTIDGNQLDFFGLTSALGTSFTILPCDDNCPPVPEPETAVLLGLGLLALAMVRRSNVIKRLLVFGPCVIALAPLANAASLSVSGDKLTYTVGETVTLTVSGDDEGATAYYAFGTLQYTGALVDNGTRSQINLEGPSGKWAKQVLYASDDGVNAFSDVFDQTTAIAKTADNLPGANPFATVTLIAKAVGFVDLIWATESPYTLDFFGLTDAPGTSFTIVPEPATAALLAIGLIGLALRPRP